MPRSESRVLLGYQPMPTADPCPFCGERHYAIEDDGNPDTYLVLCWYGARARVPKNDPDLLALLR